MSKHRAPPRQRGRPSSSARTLLGAAAVLGAVAVATTVGQAITSGGDSTTASARAATLDGSYVAKSATDELASRDATRVSRAATRPPTLPSRTSTPANKTEPGSKTEPGNKTERRRLAQYKLLRQAAKNAEKYAKRLSSREWTYPTANFRLTEPFGVPGPHWASGYHTGIDLATAYGTPVVAVGNGTVVQAGWDGAYGNQVRLQLPNRDQVWYNHLSSIEVTRGQPVLKGQALGRVGDTGNAFGYHLHLEYRLAGDLSQGVNPLPFFLDHGLTLK